MNSKIADAKYAYGITHDCFASSKASGETIVMGGIGAQSDRWARVLSRRAAHQLWFQLTRLLFPDKSLQVTAMAKTAPLHVTNKPQLTTVLEVMSAPSSDVFDIIGWIGEDTWWCRLDHQGARNLWAALDVALYPAGWQGPLTYHNKLN